MQSTQCPLVTAKKRPQLPYDNGVAASPSLCFSFFSMFSLRTSRTHARTVCVFSLLGIHPAFSYHFLSVLGSTQPILVCAYCNGLAAGWVPSKHTPVFYSSIASAFLHSSSTLCGCSAACTDFGRQYTTKWLQHAAFFCGPGISHWLPRLKYDSSFVIPIHPHPTA